MIYQNQLSGKLPYSLGLSNLNSFPMHIHHEIEIIYAVKGSVEIKINNIVYKIEEGEVALVGSMVMHEICQGSLNRKFLVIEMGSAFLKERFKLIKKLDFSIKVFKSNESPRIIECLNRIIRNHLEEDDCADVFETGYLFELYGLFYKSLCNSGTKTITTNKSEVKSIESALKYVFEHYNENITVQAVAEYCGYCKCGFCKAFKNIIGLTFHNYLNLCRVKNAEFLLSEIDSPLEDIAELVGLKDAKTLCRVFKKTTGVTPHHFRLENKNSIFYK